MSGSSLVVGIDVGGTYTDAVCLQDGRVIGVAKEPTTCDVTGGVKDALGRLVSNLSQAGHSTDFRQVNIGTTHFVNAAIQRQNLTPVAILRLCGTASRALEPCIEFPDDLKKAVYDSHYFLSGGYQYDGKVISSVDPKEIQRTLDELKARNVANIVVSCVFAPVKGDQECQVRELIQEYYPEASVTLSHEVGQMGLLERENAAILNECLKPLCRRTIRAFRQALRELDLKCPFYMTQNDGTIISSDLAIEFPVRTFSSGPTNSMRGAAHLSGISHNAIVIDIGGTTTDVGYLLHGFPRESSTRSSIAGVSTNFRMPDVKSTGLGGGSLVKWENQVDVTIGPNSVGYRLLSEGFLFGGNTLTVTDIAVAAGIADLEGDMTKIRQISDVVVSSASEKIHLMIEDIIDQVKISSDDVPVIVVGGGSILVDENRVLRGGSRLIKPPHYKSANAVGASLSQVSGTVDYVANVAEMSREDAIREADESARRAAVANGADESTLKITERQSVGLAYLPGNVIRIKVKAVGELLTSTMSKHEENEQRFQDETLLGDSDAFASQDAPPSKQVQDAETELTDDSGKRDTTPDSASPDSDDTPHIDPESGEWILSERDIEYISIGAGLLGSGGGGSPYVGKLRALKQLRSGKRIRVIASERLGTTLSLQGKVMTTAFMGAPAVLIEKLYSGTETPRAIACVKDVLNANPEDVRRQATTQDPDDEATRGLVFVQDYKLCSSQASESEERIVAIMSGEIGGLNSMEPLVTGAELDVPIVDCDGMGRAFPELQMFLPAILQKSLSPTALVGDGSQQAVVAEARTCLQVENCLRQVVGLQMGCAAAVVFAPLTAESVRTATIPYSYSRSWHLGRVVMTAQKAGKNPVSALVLSGNGVLLIEGKIIDVTRETTGGFDRGNLTVEGSGQHAGESLVVSFQNENLVAKRRQVISGVREERIVATTPDLIIVADADKAHPIPTEEVQYGLRVVVIALPSPPQLRSLEALKVVGPRAFKYDIDFVPIDDYVAPSSVPPLP